MTNRAYINQINTDLEKRLYEGLEFINWQKIIYPDSRVFIKPNLAWPEPRKGVTTTLAFMEALLSILTQRAHKVMVGESNGGTFLAEEAFAKHGLPELCMRFGVELVNLSRLPATQLIDTIAGKPIQIEASRFLLEEVDTFITLPVLKTHVVTRVTLGLKNQWGCIPTAMRLLYHHILDHGIVALNRAYNPRIAILDGTYAMDRRGPLEGDAIPAGWMVVSDNVVALDAIGAYLLGVNPYDVRHIRLAEQEKLGTADLAKIEFNMKLPEPIIHSVIKPSLMDRMAIFLYRSYLLSKLAFDSPLTPIAYKLMGRTPPGKLPAEYIPDAHSADN